jgi:hypothetical protein
LLLDSVVAAIVLLATPRPINQAIKQSINQSSNIASY